ncbi:MAG: prepilin-type N-terminal cleavage/methylation domain-containing protein [Pseudomonadota bacterium]
MDNERGFTLLEVIVALAVITMTLTSVMQIFSGGLRNAITADDYVTALAQAENQISRVGADVPVQAGFMSGQFENGNRWERRIGSAGPAGRLQRYDVTVTVFFGDDNRRVRLSTLVLRSNL